MLGWVAFFCQAFLPSFPARSDSVLYSSRINTSHPIRRSAHKVLDAKTWYRKRRRHARILSIN